MGVTLTIEDVVKAPGWRRRSHRYQGGRVLGAVLVRIDHDGMTERQVLYEGDTLTVTE